MSKMKTNRGAAKRFRKSASGSFRKKHSHARHILTKKSPKRKQQLRQPEMVSAHDQPAVKRLLPYA